MPQNVSTPAHCPGFQELRNLSAFTCKCSECGKEIEIFSDEFDRPHRCKGCGQMIDFSRCSIESSAGVSSPR